MLKSLLLACTFALGLAACTPTTPASPALSREVAMVLGAARADIGNDIAPGLTLRSAKNDGDTLIFGFTLQPSLQAAYDLEPEALDAGLIDVFAADTCNGRGMGAFLANGGAIRMEFFSATGTPLRAVTVSDCPS